MRAIVLTIACTALGTPALTGCEDAGPSEDLDYAPLGSSSNNGNTASVGARSGRSLGATGRTSAGDETLLGAQGANVVDACGNVISGSGGTGAAGDSGNVTSSDTSGGGLGNAAGNIPNATDGAGGFDGFVGTLGFAGIPRLGTGTGAAGSTGANAAGASENDGENRNNDTSGNVSGGSATGGRRNTGGGNGTGNASGAAGSGMNGNHSPMAAFVLDPTCIADATTTLTLISASLDPDGDALTCQWSFPAAFDGIEEGCTLTNVQVVSGGESIVELLVTDGRGGASIVTQTIESCP